MVSNLWIMIMIKDSSASSAPREQQHAGYLRYPVWMHRKLVARAHRQEKSWSAHLRTYIRLLLQGRLAMINPQGEILRLMPDGSKPEFLGKVPRQPPVPDRMAEEPLPMPGAAS